MLGQVKTRLAATIGDEKALEIYKLLLNHTHAITADLKCVKNVYYSDSIIPVDIWNKGGFTKRVQSGDDLGERMLNAFESAFNDGHEQVMIIGSDCYQLSTEMILDGFNHLNQHDVVIGPAEDGGYYLLGLNGLIPALFSGKAWSTDSVCNETLADVEKLNLSYKLLPTLNDVDVAEDLKRSNIPLNGN